MTQSCLFELMLYVTVNNFNLMISWGGGGGGGGELGVNLTKKNSLVLSLFYRSQMVNFKENYHFSRFQRGSNIFQGGSNCLFPIETHITCDFPGGGPDPLSPPLDPHLNQY